MTKTPPIIITTTATTATTATTVTTTRQNHNEIFQQSIINPILLASSFSLLFIFAFQDPAYAYTSSFDETFFPNSQPTTTTTSSKYYKNVIINDPKIKARKQVRELQELQDSRLDICADKGENWEQCFMFGESPDSYNDIPLFGLKKIINVNKYSNNDDTDNDNGVTRQRVNAPPPTW